MPLFKGEGDATITLEGFDAEDIGAAPKVHGHGIDQVTGLQQALEQKQPAGEYQPAGDYAPAIHEHGIENVTGLQEALDSKQPADGDLALIAQLSTTPFGRSLLERANAQELRSALEIPNFSVGVNPPSNPGDYHQWIELDPSGWVKMRWFWSPKYKRWLSLELESSKSSFANISTTTTTYTSMGENFSYDYQLIHFRGKVFCTSPQSSTNFWTISLNSTAANNAANYSSGFKTNDVTTLLWSNKLGYYTTPGDQAVMGLIQKSTDFPVISTRAVPSNAAGALFAATEFTYRWVRP